MFKKFLAVLCLVMVTLSTSVQAAQSEHPAEFYQRYQLQKMLVFSRHNIRASLTGKDSFVDKITPHKWFAWSSAPGELSLRGGQLETMVGQYFRKRLVRDGLITENYLPKEGEMRFYSNSLQRTIATAQYFSSGMLPVANVRIEHKLAVGKKDPVFNYIQTYMSDAYRAEAAREIAAFGGSKGLDGLEEGLKDNYKLLEEVLDVKQSPLYKKGTFQHFYPVGAKLQLEQNKMPLVLGTANSAMMACDTLIMQYYEEPDDLKAAFNHKLTTQDWEKIGQILETHYAALFGAHVVAVNLGHPLLQVMSQELALDSRKFTFLCGHDINIFNLVSALEVEPYQLPRSILKKAPIGAKLVIEKWAGKDGQEYASLSLVYLNTQQLRSRSMLDLDHPPMIYPLTLRGLTRNADGLYKFSDLQARFAKAVAAYDQLPGRTAAVPQTELPQAA
jgi:glucose-1-phosphatase